MGLEKPISMRYGHWVWDAWQGEFGRCYVNDYVVMDAVKEPLPNTWYLLGLTMLTAIIVGVSIGMISAIWRVPTGDLIAGVI